MQVRQLFLRLGAGDNGSITYQMLEEQMNSDAAPCFQHSFFIMCFDPCLPTRWCFKPLAPK